MTNTPLPGDDAEATDEQGSLVAGFQAIAALPSAGADVLTSADLGMAGHYEDNEDCQDCD